MTRKVGFDHTDPGLRPFIEVEAKISLAILGQAREEETPARDVVAALADSATHDAEEGAKELSDRTLGPGRLLPVCQAGCSYCCHSTVHASAPEILRVASFVKETFPPERLSELRERAEKTAALVRDMDLVERARARIPCPLLDTATGACTVYEVRPVTCRAYYSGDVAPCKAAFEQAEPNPVLPINPALFHVAHAYGFGMLTGCASEGLDVGPYDLAATLATALADDLDARWLAGERVLSHTKLSEGAQPGYERVLGELVSDLRAGRLDDAEKIADKLDPDARRKERNRRKRERRKR